MSIAAPRPAPVLVEAAAAADLGEGMAIMASAFSPEFGESWTLAQCAGILPMSGVVLSLARAGDGAATGFSLLRTVADEAELLLIAVDPRARRRGVGRALLDHFVSHAERCGARRLHLEVREGNPAIGLYRAGGFEIAGRRRNYYRGRDGSRYDALTLVRIAAEH